MQMLSEDDLDLASMSDAELDAAWDLWFDLASSTDPFDPPYSHGVFVSIGPTPEPPQPAKRKTQAQPGAASAPRAFR